MEISVHSMGDKVQALPILLCSAAFMHTRRNYYVFSERIVKTLPVQVHGLSPLNSIHRPPLGWSVEPRFLFYNINRGNSLAIWSEFCAFTAGAWVRPLVRTEELASFVAVKTNKKIKPLTTCHRIYLFFFSCHTAFGIFVP